MDSLILFHEIMAEFNSVLIAKLHNARKASCWRKIRRLKPYFKCKLKCSRRSFRRG